MNKEFASSSALKDLLRGPPEAQTLGQRLGFWPSTKAPTFQETFNDALTVQTVAGVMRSPSFSNWVDEGHVDTAARTPSGVSAHRWKRDRKQMFEEMSLLIVVEIAEGAKKLAQTAVDHLAKQALDRSCNSPLYSFTSNSFFFSC